MQPGVRPNGVAARLDQLNAILQRLSVQKCSQLRYLLTGTCSVFRPPRSRGRGLTATEAAERVAAEPAGYTDIGCAAPRREIPKNENHIVIVLVSIRGD